MFEEDVWIIVISAEIISGCSSAVGADVKPASGLGSRRGLLFHSTSANVTMTTESSERDSLLPLLLYDATGVAPAFVLMSASVFSPQSKPSLLYNGTVQYNRVI